MIPQNTDWIEEYGKVRGILKIRSFDENNNLIEEFEDNNLIMNEAREAMQYMQGNVSVSGVFNPINGIKVGNFGTLSINDSAGNPRQPGLGTDDYSPSRNKLFQEESMSQQAFCFHQFFSNVSGDQGQMLQSDSHKMFQGSQELQSYNTQNCRMTRSVQDRVITFDIDISGGQANNPNGDDINYSEVALMQGDKIFSMKTFQPKAKNSQTKLIITWSIIF